jgi:hypothetical protein
MNPSSFGRGLGQITGSDSPLADASEARRILAIIAEAGLDTIEYHCGKKAASIVHDMRASISFGPSFSLTGKQLFALREIKDQLIEKGIV